MSAATDNVTRLLEHGTRPIYRRGCRCVACRAANARYVAVRRRRRAEADARCLVASDEVRAYLQGLQAKGIGYRQAAKRAGLSPTEVLEIRNGARRQVLQATAAKIFAATPQKAFGARVKAHPTWRLVRLLLKEGYTRRQLAQRLGLSAVRLSAQDDYVTLQTALAVQAFYRRTMADDRLLGSGDTPDGQQEASA